MFLPDEFYPVHSSITKFVLVKGSVGYGLVLSINHKYAPWIRMPNDSSSMTEENRNSLTQVH